MESIENVNIKTDVEIITTEEKSDVKVAEENSDLIKLSEIYEQIKKNDEVNKRIDLASLEDILEKGEKPPGIEEVNDLPSGKEVITESKKERPKKPWEKSN